MQHINNGNPSKHTQKNKTERDDATNLTELTLGYTWHWTNLNFIINVFFISSVLKTENYIYYRKHLCWFKEEINYKTSGKIQYA